MNKFLIVIQLVLLLGIPVRSHTQVQFIEVETAAEMKEAREKASAGELLLFVDVYATWCGPCKMMDRDVYTEPAVAAYMNGNFVSVRMDGETDFGRRYAAEQKLEGYPSMFIFGPEGDPVSRLVGFMPAEELLGSLRNTAVNYKEVKAYRKAYEGDSLTLEAFASYIDAVRRMGNEEEAERLAGEYIRDQMSGELSDNDIRVVAFYTNLEDTWWALFTSDPDRIRRVLGEGYLPAMEQIYHNTLVKAVEQENVKLISRMANELSPLVEATASRSWDLRTLPFIQYFYYTDQVQELVDYVDNRFASDRAGDHRWLYGVAAQIIDMDQQQRTPELLLKGEEWLSVCIRSEEQFDYYFYHGMVLFFQEKREEAMTSFEKASGLASSEEERSMINQVFRYVNR